MQNGGKLLKASATGWGLGLRLVRVLALLGPWMWKKLAL